MATLAQGAAWQRLDQAGWSGADLYEGWDPMDIPIGGMSLMCKSITDSDGIASVCYVWVNPDGTVTPATVAQIAQVMARR